MQSAPMLVVGLAAALLMFAGDMLLYFTPGAYDMDGTLAPYARIMRDLPRRRVMAGALLGPVAAVLYLVGFATIGLGAQGDFAWVVRLAAVLLAFALVCGGTYHAQYAYLQIAAQEGDDRLVNRVTATITPLEADRVAPRGRRACLSRCVASHPKPNGSAFGTIRLYSPFHEKVLSPQCPSVRGSLDQTG